MTAEDAEFVTRCFVTTYGDHSTRIWEEWERRKQEEEPKKQEEEQRLREEARKQQEWERRKQEEESDREKERKMAVLATVICAGIAVVMIVGVVGLFML